MKYLLLLQLLITSTIASARYLDGYLVSVEGLIFIDGTYQKKTYQMSECNLFEARRIALLLCENDRALDCRIFEERQRFCRNKCNCD